MPEASGSGSKPDTPMRTGESYRGAASSFSILATISRAGAAIGPFASTRRYSLNSCKGARASRLRSMMFPRSVCTGANSGPSAAKPERAHQRKKDEAKRSHSLTQTSQRSQKSKKMGQGPKALPRWYRTERAARRKRGCQTGKLASCQEQMRRNPSPRELAAWWRSCR